MVETLRAVDAIPGFRSRRKQRIVFGYSEFNLDRRKVDAGENVCSTSDGLAIAKLAVG